MQKLFHIPKSSAHKKTKYLLGLWTQKVLHLIPALKNCSIFQFTIVYHWEKWITKKFTIIFYLHWKIQKINEIDKQGYVLYIRLPLTTDPSFGRSKPSPTLVILLRTFLSPVTSMTLFQDTSSSLMVKLESGGTSSMSIGPFLFCLKPFERNDLRLIYANQ